MVSLIDVLMYLPNIECILSTTPKVQNKYKCTSMSTKQRIVII